MKPNNLYELVWEIEELILNLPNDSDLGNQIRALMIQYNSADADSGNLGSQ